MAVCSLQAWVGFGSLLKRELEFVMSNPCITEGSINANEKIWSSLLWQAHSIHQYGIPISLHINSDQTQVIYQQNATSTYEKKGSHQVSTVGHKEKHAFTLNVAISASGTLLPFQAIFQGKMSVSIPVASSLGYDEAMQLGFHFKFSGNNTYWANISTMKLFVMKILVPYFNSEMEQLSLDPPQECIWQLDVWPVHASLEFHTWLYQKYPWIILDYVPGGCTGLWQPCNVSIQHMLKHAVKRSQQSAAINEVYSQLQSGVDEGRIKLDTKLGVLRDCVPQTLVYAF